MRRSGATASPRPARSPESIRSGSAAHSREVGIEKPDRRIYEITCQELGVHPGDVVFLDDLEANVVAATQLGMRAVLFQSTAQAITDLEACLAESAS